MTRLDEIREKFKTHLLNYDDTEFLLSEIERKNKALADLGNLLGGPCCDYVPELAYKEKECRIDSAVTWISAALRDGEGK